jgi:L-ascorbate 6-phosphate lactonase
MRDLAAEIRATTVPPGAMAIWWLGQLSFVLKGAGRTAAIDLYLSDYPGGARRSYPPPVSAAALTTLDLVCCTHEHIDHIDPWTLGPLATASPKAMFLVPRPCVPAVRDILPTARVIATDADAPLTVNGVDVMPIPAAHDRLEATPEGHRFQGYIVRLGDVRICHTGDTVMYDGLVERIRAQQVDILLAPINGRDYFRTGKNIIGNLDVREAADLAVAAGVKLLIPGHWDLFAHNAVNPGHLFEYLARHHPEQPCHYMARGERFIYFPGG